MQRFDWVWLALAGAGGAMTRMGLGKLPVFSMHPAYLIATILCNLLGSFLLTFIMFSTTTFLTERIKLLVSVGFFGAFTTFSALSLEFFHLLQAERYAGAIGYIALTACGGLCSAWLGFRFARRMRKGG